MSHHCYMYPLRLLLAAARAAEETGMMVEPTLIHVPFPIASYSYRHDIFVRMTHREQRERASVGVQDEDRTAAERGRRASVLITESEHIVQGLRLVIRLPSHVRFFEPLELAESVWRHHLPARPNTRGMTIGCAHAPEDHQPGIVASGADAERLRKHGTDDAGSTSDALQQSIGGRAAEACPVERSQREEKGGSGQCGCGL